MSLIGVIKTTVGACLLLANVMIIGDYVFKGDNGGSGGSGSTVFSANLFLLFFVVATLVQRVFRGAVNSLPPPIETTEADFDEAIENDEE